MFSRDQLPVAVVGLRLVPCGLDDLGRGGAGLALGKRHLEFGPGIGRVLHGLSHFLIDLQAGEVVEARTANRLTSAPPETAPARIGGGPPFRTPPARRPPPP